ncbi:MAG: helix-turn-helix domain-containing protein [Dehalococcoidia bacterium]
MSLRADSDLSRKSYNSPCTIASVLDLVGDRWTLLIVRDLMAGLSRYTDILGNCGHISPNVLSERLKRLEADGIVVRNYFKELPPRVEYTLTEKGWALRPILSSLIDWGRQYLDSTLSEESEVTPDFAVRTVSAFAFNPQRAENVRATLVVEIKDCEGCDTWTLEIREGQIRPRRHATDNADLRLQTTTDGFFRFVRGELPAEQCGNLVGSSEVAALIQTCFQH